VEDFQKILSFVQSRYSYFIIGCDLNFNMLDRSHKLHDLLKANNLFSGPFSPTRDRAWLDQFIVPKPEKCRILRSNEYTLPDISDHDYLTVSYQV